MNERRSRRTVSPADVADYWLAQYSEAPLRDVPAGFAELVVDPGEPSCFRCGWRVPDTPGAATHKSVWRRANKWLDMAHLCDFSAYGVDDVQNIVMLCRSCHRAMPPFTDGQSALEWVQDCPSTVRHLARMRALVCNETADWDVAPCFQEIEDIMLLAFARRDEMRL